ncbi:sensor histidine kinase [Actinophytocola sp.]|uniref:sensor histidine kinase n=1 Tax=Actinophytocola sp. TaxID=1872138 RepID=UPI00389A7EB5
MAEQRKKSGWSWPDEPAGPPTRAGRIAGIVMSTVFLIYLVSPIKQVFEHPHPVAARVLVVVTVAVYAVIYTAVYMAFSLRRTRFTRRVRIAGVVAMFACGIMLAVVLGPDDLMFLTYAISAALMQLPPMVGLLLGLGTTTTLLIGTQIAEGAPDWNSASILVVLTVAMFGMRQVIMANAELRAARDEIATLAVAEERARMARDLHDVLGHSLTTIAVKAGLARRILESSGDDERAIAELRDVETLSRTALGEVRSTVSGHRKASLAAELVGARVALQAAEISADLPHAVDNVPAELQEPFAYVLREGVTNVIRHSNARHCSVRLGQSWIEIRDDGTPPEEPSSNGHGHGHGLVGLSERLAKVGGAVSAGPAAPTGGFVVRASVPAAVTA